MEVIKINKTFATQKECAEWEKTVLPTVLPKDSVVFSIMHESVVGSDEVILTEVWVC